jgi:hypothetical protein
LKGNITEFRKGEKQQQQRQQQSSLLVQVNLGRLEMKLHEKKTGKKRGKSGNKWR